jgi:ABC-type nitrate/sulfonate/bicarbonate transport system substrate-binding protein
MSNRLSLFLAVALAAFAFSCGGQRVPAAAVRISVPFSVSSIPVLELDGIEVAGRKIVVSIFQDHALTLAQFLKGDVDILMTGFTQGTAAYAGNPDVRELATLVWGVSSIMVRDRAVKTLADLAGKKLTVPFAKSPLDLQTRAILKAKGLDGKVSIEYGPPQQAAALLLAGKTDAIAVPEPIPSQLEAGGKAFRLARYQDLWAAVAGDPRSPQVSLFVLKGFAEANREFTAALVKAAAEKTQAVSADPAGAAERRAAAFKMDKTIVKKGLENTLFATPGRVEDTRLCAEFLSRLGLEPIDPAFYAEY